ncbi:universal stress protein [Gelidibacter maritimus]|uniref:Universal stress protein n=1 Tax=Gelidibacter maritimus TaxID=2761487 RepID=A0A7W2R359_9FLAO|nr:universal stress protein [Gelidibacter maritimus]MBA6152487.1 universal stress protein [Gelidibacter maritimus]
MRQHILIPTDFSDNAWSAARYALSLYADEPCTFYFSYAWTFLNSGARTHISQSYIDPLIEKSKEQLAEVKARAEKESTNPEHKFETIYTVGSLEECIEVSIKKHNINLVFMGTKGATGAKKYILGSNTVSVINKVRLCPIMLVPTKCEFVKPDQIAFPSDFSRFFGEDLLPITQLADMTKATINVLHIKSKDGLTETQNENFERLKTHLKDYAHTFNWLPSNRAKADVISDFIKENNVKILTMINYEHSFIENIIKEPIIKKLGFKSKIPFLVIPRKD